MDLHGKFSHFFWSKYYSTHTHIHFELLTFYRSEFQKIENLSLEKYFLILVVSIRASSIAFVWKTAEAWLHHCVPFLRFSFSFNWRIWGSSKRDLSEQACISWMKFAQVHPHLRSGHPLLPLHFLSSLISFGRSCYPIINCAASRWSLGWCEMEGSGIFIFGNYWLLLGSYLGG